MNLVTLSTDGQWGGAADDVNENFSRVNMEVERLRNATVNNKGYFTDVSLLIAAWPSPSAGDFAWAGSPFPGTVYECRVAGAWTDTGIVPDVPGVDINNWSKTNW